MHDNRMSKTEFAQSALSMIVTTKVSLAIQNQLFDRSNIDPDRIPGQIASVGVGALVGAATRPLTDKIVDESVTRVQSWHAKRKQKKSENE